MQTTPNLGLSIPSADADAFDHTPYDNAFLRLDGLVLAKLWDSSEAGVVFPVATITSPTLPQTFKHLRVRLALGAVSGTPNVIVSINGDATDAHYSHGTTDITNSTVSGSTVADRVSGSVATAGSFSQNLSEIAYFNYANSQVEHAFATRCEYWLSPNWIHRLSGGNYSPGSAHTIQALTFALSGGGNLTGGRITIYGEP